MSRVRPILFLFVLFCSIVALLAGCGGNENVPFAANEQAQLTCSDECAAHGQCGMLNEEQRVVLANDGGPAVTLHDRFFLDGTISTIVEISQRQLIAARDGIPLNAESTPFPHIFYRVNGEGKTAWVSEWCLARP